MTLISPSFITVVFSGSTPFGDRAGDIAYSDTVPHTYAEDMERSDLSFLRLLTWERDTAHLAKIRELDPFESDRRIDTEFYYQHERYGPKVIIKCPQHVGEVAHFHTSERRSCSSIMLVPGGSSWFFE